MIQAYPVNTCSEEVVSELFGLPAVPVGHINWKEFPYKPDVTVRLGYSSTALAILFEVEEDHVLGSNMEDCGPVWEDSCCEFFVSDPCGEGYFNFEMNCIGTLLAAKRRSRDDFEFLTKEQLRSIARYCSLPHAPTDSVKCGQKYWIAEVIPFSLLGLEEVPKSLRANFYKCGDKCNKVHFLSMAPVGTPSPDFHRPEFFQEIFFAANN